MMMMMMAVFINYLFFLFSLCSLVSGYTADDDDDTPYLYVDQRGSPGGATGGATGQRRPAGGGPTPDEETVWPGAAHA